MTTAPTWTDEDELLYERALDDLAVVRGMLARPSMVGSYREKTLWRLRACEWWAEFHAGKRTEAGA